MKKLISILITGSVLLSSQACGPQYKVWRKDDVSTKSACDLALFEEFQTTFHPLVRTIGCQNCHTPGGQKEDAPFAQQDPWAAFYDFKKRGPSGIEQRIQEGHNQASLGYDQANLAPILASYATGWKNVESTCDLGGLAVLTDTKTSQIFDPAGIDDLAKCGLGDPLRADHLSYQAVTWDLGQFRQDLAGITVKISVKAESAANIAGQICAHLGYRAGNVTIASAKKLRVKNIRILLNGNSYNVNTFMVEREVPAGATAFQLIESSTGGFAVFDSGTAKAADKWSLIIEKMEVLQ